jgi:hypothetical protein
LNLHFNNRWGQGVAVVQELQTARARITALRTSHRTRPTHRSESLTQERALCFGIQAVAPTFDADLLRATTHAKPKQHEGKHQ